MINAQPSLAASPTDIAIVGMAGRFPGARTLDKFWENLRNGVVSMTHFNEHELREAGVAEGDLADTNYVRTAARIDNAEDFDADYFNFSPVEANFIDPQHRIFLECSVEALEDAGCDPSRFLGRIGVYAGCALNIRHLSRALLHFDETLGEPQLFTILANDKDYLATRLSYKLNLSGPSINLQAACSTSLVAVHLACQSLLSGECDAALAGGASVVFSYAKMGYRFSEGSVFSKDGICRPFDAAASGTVFGDGVGVVVLKRLADALASGDNIRAIIKGSAINNDGSRKASFAAPSTSGQASVVAEAIAMASVPPETISYIEAHGTGTLIGDPIEIEGLKRVFKSPRSTDRCALGSVKGNIGHLNAAAGVAGLIKTVMALEHDEIPPTANFGNLNPTIDFTGTAFFVNNHVVPWEEVSPYRRAGVSSFGIGGTNAHVVLEAAPPRTRSAEQEIRNRVFLLSARNASALDELALSMNDFLEETPTVDLTDLAHTLTTGRTRHVQGLAVIGSESAGIARALATRSADCVIDGKILGDAPQVAMIFPGQGSQCQQMGLDIHRYEPVYREAFDRCMSILRDAHSLDLEPIIRARAGDARAGANQLDRTDYAQPAVFATSYALAQLWLSWGVEPSVLIGHSLGELVAACIAGVFSLEDALGLVVTRGRLMNEAKPGAMVAIMIEPENVLHELGSDLFIASYNGPASCVLAGPLGSVEELLKRLIVQGIPHTQLRTSHAFHTPAMASAVVPFIAAVAATERKMPLIPIISNVTGDWITAEQATSPEYWGNHILQPVRFAQGAATLSKSFEGILLEVGPGRQMSGLLGLMPENPYHLIVPSMPQPGHRTGEHAKLLRAAASTALAGIKLDWQAINGTENAYKIVAPKYPFQRRTYGLGASNAQTDRQVRDVQHEGPSTVSGVKFYEPAWKRIRLPQSTPDRPARSWLVFGNQQSFDTGLCDKLRRAGDQVIVVTKSLEFRNHGSASFGLTPQNQQHFESLVSALMDSEKLPDGIIYAWPLDPSDAPDTAVETAFFDVTRLVTLIKTINFENHIDVFLLAANGQDVFGDNNARPAGAALVGLARSLPEEFEALSVTYLDMDHLDLTELRVDSTVNAIGQALSASSPSILALRKGRWHVPLLEQLMDINAATAIDQLIEHGAWLITGGLGGIGLAIASGLTRRGVKKLALVSRRTLPARTEWDTCMAAKSPEAEVMQTIQALEADGATIEILSADVANEAELAKAFAKARHVFGQLDAVIHCAGVVDGGQAATKTAETALGVLRPKVAGTLHIEKVSAEASLELLVLCSSVTTLLNNPGQTDYATANAFLDGFASSSTGAAKRVIAINWDSWTEVGMAASYSVPEAFREARDIWLKSGLSTSEGVRAFFDVLGSDASRIVVSKLGLNSEGCLLQLVPPRSGSSESGTGTGTGTVHPRPDLGVPYAAPRGEVESTAARIMAEMLNLQAVGIDDNFLDLGCHSLTATRFAAKMRQETGVIIPLAIMFEGLTLRTTIDALELEKWEEGVI